MNVSTGFRQRHQDTTGTTAQFQDPSLGRGNEAGVEGNICGSIWTQIVVFGGLRPSIGWHRCLSGKLTLRHEPRGVPRRLHALVSCWPCYPSREDFPIIRDNVATMRSCSTPLVW
jgi:hypothetical protein